MMAAPTLEEKELIKQLRLKVMDLRLDVERNSDMNLVRWLRARDNKVDRAEAMLRKAILYEETLQKKNLQIWEPPRQLQEMCPMDTEARDRDGNPVVFIPFGRWDIKAITAGGYYDDYIMYMEKMWHTLEEKMKGRKTPEGVPMTQLLCIVDVDQISFGQLMSWQAVQSLKTITSSFMDNKPERLKASYAINVSRTFQAFYAIVRPLLTARTAEKIKFLGAADEWKPALREKIPEDLLPEHYGGKADSVLHEFLGHAYRSYNSEDPCLGVSH